MALQERETPAPPTDRSITGGRVNGASPAYNVEEMTYALNVAKSRFLITLPTSLDVALAAAKNAGIPRHHVFLLEGSAAGCESIQELMVKGERYTPDPPFQIPSDKTNKEVCGYLNFSSGTTGLPKAVSGLECRYCHRRWMSDRLVTRSCSRTTTSLRSAISSNSYKHQVLTRSWL